MHVFIVKKNGDLKAYTDVISVEKKDGHHVIKTADKEVCHIVSSTVEKCLAYGIFGEDVSDVIKEKGSPIVDTKKALCDAAADFFDPLFHEAVLRGGKYGHPADVDLARECADLINELVPLRAKYYIRADKASIGKTYDVLSMVFMYLLKRGIPYSEILDQMSHRLKGEE